MDAAGLQRALDEMFDEALVYHGFTDYMRDYEAVVELHAVADTPVRHRRYLFRYCVQATCRSTIRPQVWPKSLDDGLIEFPPSVDSDGFVWGVKWQNLYPGAKEVAGSMLAAEWTRELGIEFHEVRIETNVHDLTLVFSDLRISDLAEGYTPFRVRA